MPYSVLGNEDIGFLKPFSIQFCCDNIPERIFILHVADLYPCFLFSYEEIHRLNPLKG